MRAVATRERVKRKPADLQKFATTGFIGRRFAGNFVLKNMRKYPQKDIPLKRQLAMKAVSMKRLPTTNIGLYVSSNRHKLKKNRRKTSHDKITLEEKPRNQIATDSNGYRRSPRLAKTIAKRNISNILSRAGIKYLTIELF